MRLAFVCVVVTTQLLGACATSETRSLVNRADVRAAAAAEIPEGFVAIPGTLKVSFADIQQVSGEGNTATLTQAATALGSIVRQGDLASAIARRSVEGYQGEAVQFAEAVSMNLTVASTSNPLDGTLTLEMSGQATLVWQFDPNALTQALVGKNKSEFQTAIEAFQPAVQKADASIRPFWQGRFPDNADKIKVKIAGQ